MQLLRPWAWHALTHCDAVSLLVSYHLCWPPVCYPLCASLLKPCLVFAHVGKASVTCVCQQFVCISGFLWVYMCVSQVVVHMFPKRGNLTMHLQRCSSPPFMWLLVSFGTKQCEERLSTSGGFSLQLWEVLLHNSQSFLLLLMSCLGLWIRRPENWKHFSMLFCCWCFSFPNIWFFAVSLWFLLNKCFFYIYNNMQKFSFLRWISDTIYFYSVRMAVIDS